ncbi:DUF4164 domain-containing protein [Antarcticirhabdus aurantiaca]|uniref:DUF4164 domain-containing protein n=1 Tax=Antarcticirhabdus aurantiaca TaxID=2606717 RepID=A0ACD4NTQ2_9HYPH|nr:DUF4164 domain-containing protein [Antarcticirhabdus aurantiaca]WAJ30240.1 DUF4164 domain-containing protein [Jeongeuplla avenae]
MSEDDPFEAARRRLSDALSRLTAVVEIQTGPEGRLRGGEEEMQRMSADRARLAGELDAALARCERLEGANREVSARLVNAMEAVRGVLQGAG